jgi:hypothetical protein
MAWAEEKVLAMGNGWRRVLRLTNDFNRGTDEERWCKGG